MHRLLSMLIITCRAVGLYIYIGSIDITMITFNMFDLSVVYQYQHRSDTK